MIKSFLYIAGAFCFGLSLYASEIYFTGEIIENEDLSAVSSLGPRYLVLGSDEGHSLQLLQRSGDDSYSVMPGHIPLLNNQQEVDIEGIATLGNQVFVTGSASMKRNLVDLNLSRQQNLERLLKVNSDYGRRYVFRLEIDPMSGLVSKNGVEKVDLFELLAKDPLLGRFTDIPSKENGVDIEGLAIDEGGLLYFGFRGPILRGGWTPVLVVDSEEIFEKPLKSVEYEIRFIKLDGRGIRDMVRVDEGFLIIGGAVGDTPTNSRVYFWDGLDMLPDNGKVATPLKEIYYLPTVFDGELNVARAEGLALIDETNSYYEILVVHDGAENGSPHIIQIAK